MGIQELMTWLRRETMMIVDLRYNGRWCVMTELGNIMAVVHGTVTDDPIRSLTIAKRRWETRGPDNFPF